MIKKTIGILFLLVAVPAITFAQYGKISGTVTDRDSKEPLVGATIVLQGSNLGASTDINGKYVILSVPAGNYTIRATYVGYHELIITDVSVLAGLTRDMNIELTSTAVQVSGVEVVAQRPLIEKTATNAVRIQSAGELQKLPVRGVQAYFTLQPGVVLQNGVAYIRGGRADEVGYQIEGASVTNIVGAVNALVYGSTGNEMRSDYSASLINTIPEALQEVSVQSGGYGADMGGASSGIVQQVFKTGGSKFNFSLQGETDNFGGYPGGKKFLDTYSYGYSDYVVSLGGPVFSDKVKLFVAGENLFQRDNNPWFWSGANFGYMQDEGQSGGVNSHTGDSAYVSWPAGNVPGRMNNRYTGNGTLLFDFKPVQVRIAGAFTWSRTMNNNVTHQILDLARLPVRESNNGLLDAKVSYFVSANTFVEFNANYLQNRTKSFEPAFGDNVLAYDDSVAVAQAYGYTYQNISSAPINYYFAGFPFERPGAVLAAYSKDNQNYWGGSIDLTSQMSNHEFKVGGSYQYWTVSHYDIGSIGLFSTLYTNPDVARNSTDLAQQLRAFGVNNFGYDEFGTPVSSGSNGPKHPYFAAGYVQDRIEFSDLVINAGLRLDYLFLDDWSISDPLNPPISLTSLTLTPGTARAFAYVEPRLGFSFPVTDRTVFHLQYGKFIQAPSLYTAYTGTGVGKVLLSGGHFYTASVGFNLSPIRTTQYEIGFSQQLSDFVALDVTGFYKDVNGQVQLEWFNPASGSKAQPYVAYQNGDFETSMGVEFSLRTRRVNRLQALVNYTLQDARGTNSFPNATASLLNVSGGLVTPTMVTPLTFDQAHRGSVSLDYRWAPGDGGPILEQLGLNVLLTFNSGHPFTLSKGGGQLPLDEGNTLNDRDARGRIPLEPVNNSTTPWVYQFDFRLDKTVNISGVGLNIYLYVQNLLNTQNVINVYYATGNAYDDGWLNTASGQAAVQSHGQTYADLWQVVNIENNQAQYRLNGFVNFGTPRQIRLGARVEL